MHTLENLIRRWMTIVYLDTYSTESGYAEADCAGEVFLYWSSGYGIAPLMFTLSPFNSLYEDS